ncbi:MAG: hypothetical protein KQ78_00951 [Candidatus Izimaplasma bacterium HR2]|nr:MAG: hypothetical protein KQ78_00951 [Candidatus Izimaplasma bacterium HR2]
MEPIGNTNINNQTNQLLKISKRFDMKQIKKLKILIMFRLLDKLEETDNDEIYHLTEEMINKLRNIDIRKRSDIRDYRKIYSLLINVIKKKYPHIAKRVISNKGTLIASSSTMGTSHSSVSSGVIGAAVALASSLKYDDGSKKNDK